MPRTKKKGWGGGGESSLRLRGRSSDRERQMRAGGVHSAGKPSFYAGPLGRNRKKRGKIRSVKPCRSATAWPGKNGKGMKALVVVPTKGGNWKVKGGKKAETKPRLWGTAKCDRTGLSKTGVERGGKEGRRGPCLWGRGL